MSSGGLKLPKGWEVKKLGEISLVGAGNSAPQNKELFKNGKYFFIRTSDVGKIKKGHINSSNDLLSEEGILKLKLHKAGTILFPKSGASTFLNHRVIMDIDGYVSSHLATIKPNKRIKDRYVWFYLIMIDAKDLMQNIAYPSLKLSDIRKIPIPIPLFPEQKRIVAILDKAFAEIAKAEAIAKTNLQNAKELFESYLDNVFKNKSDDWEEKLLGDICKIESKLIDPKELKYQDFIHIGAGNIVSEKGMLIDLKTAKEEALISGKFLFDDSMVLYSKIRPYLMKIVKCEFKGLCSADIYPLTPIKGKLVQSFLYYLLLSSHFTKYAIEGSQRAGMPKVNRKHLFNYSFYCPLVKQQKQIIQKLDQLQFEIKKLEKIYQQKNESLIALRKSILQKAFEGEL
ncbi:restriction endonuclease subunit S [Bathymodiolus thermophilus thioautotrophic gill symbiont]|uniref:Restriction endonuclease subunit S n=1 Tax=Bathymodiolus thermophilus thioautotrophic gill symbiont TaxID=2360 RepID=A0A3G3ILU2_9GAMM|nr:restriction endonuclease subunit S [Bathymodiolus thermophilus thioautotrophic gill symbiont]AYQ56452.1 restriction endonuclease subunit S [Bathymodiolus thermophilus thioautotrophic gill symbiont]